MIYNYTSVSFATQSVANTKFFLTSSVLGQEEYGECLTTFKQRLGLIGDQDLYVLVNVTMSPWPTTAGFLNEMVRDFRTIAEQQVQVRVLIQRRCMILNGE